MSNKGWIGVDLDGTLAHYDGWKGPTHIGEPVPEMIERVKMWLAEGKRVKIFTARVWHGTPQDYNLLSEYNQRCDEARLARIAIEKWCVDHIGQMLEVTNVKDFGMIQLWDDRCVQVEPNIGMNRIENLTRDHNEIRQERDQLKERVRQLIHQLENSCGKRFIPPRGLPAVECRLPRNHDGIHDASERILKAARDHEREFVDAIINAIGEISVAEAQQAIAKWRQEHA
jgi:hypothetical protein